MLICLFIALLATFIWVNILIAESVTARVNPYSNAEEDKKRAILKNYLVLIMALFWAIVLRYW